MSSEVARIRPTEGAANVDDQSSFSCKLTASTAPNDRSRCQSPPKSLAPVVSSLAATSMLDNCWKSSAKATPSSVDSKSQP